MYTVVYIDKSIKKIVGTLVPISALSSEKVRSDDQGSFAVGGIFLDWLHRTHQSLWQFLPLHETQLEEGRSRKRVSSPYKSYGVGLDPKYLCKSASELRPSLTQRQEFVQKHSAWIHDYALFCALRDHFVTDDWRRWDGDLCHRDSAALDKWAKKLAAQIDYHITIQWQLHRSYRELQHKAKDLKIRLGGDMPFYLSINSPLVWVHQELFDLEDDGSMRTVSGVPYSFFGRQVWGHPLYDWDIEQKRKAILSLWKLRLSYVATLYDYLRFDYAEAFFLYGAIDPKDPDRDKNKIGPGASIFEELVTYGRSQGLSIFVEDSGVKNDEMYHTLNRLDCPRIITFRFALDEKRDRIHDSYAKVADYPPLSVACTSTHDTETLLGYLEILTTEQRRKLAQLAGATYAQAIKEFAVNLRQTVINSAATIVIIPIQDWLLTNERINVPGTEVPHSDPNWQFVLRTQIENLPRVY